MVARIATGALAGVDAHRVDVEVSLTRGLPNVFVIGLPDGAVREARLRVENAFKALRLAMPGKRVTISLAPCSTRKAGCTYDLPMAVGLLSAMEIVPERPARRLMFAGELGLDGTLRPIRGALALGLLAREAGLEGLVVPAANAAEAAVVEGVPVFGARDLGEVIGHLTGEASPLPQPPTPFDFDTRSDDDLDLADVRGQVLAKRALELAAAGGHHLLMIGPPGTGKTMLARRLAGILPPLCLEEALEITKVYSAAGQLGAGPLVTRRPFRTPHHTASQAALVGGGSGVVRVGELSLAHHGVLFLDEVAELPRPVLDGLRQPLERGRVEIARADHRVSLPARAQLVLALNPCPCGYRWESSGRECVCSPYAADRYRGRISGPLLDRIDLQAGVDPVPFGQLALPAGAPTTPEVRARVIAARAIQRARFAESRHAPVNAWMTARETRHFCALGPDAHRLLHRGAEQLGLSARGVDRVLRVARTAADLEGAPRIRAPHLAEALTFRQVERVLHDDPVSITPSAGRAG